MQRFNNPIPIFVDARGLLLDGGQIYVGEANADPQDNPIDLFWDKALSIPAVQPLRTIGGRIVNGATPANVFFNEEDCSVRILDQLGALVDYQPSYQNTDVTYQPLDSDLTAIAALATTDFGRNLLTLANQAALRTAVGYPNPLPLAGGQVTGDITRQGVGTYVYNLDPANSGRLAFVGEGASNPFAPNKRVGDIWFEIA